MMEVLAVVGQENPEQPHQIEISDVYRECVADLVI
jgi:hypothetical protein